MENNIYGYHPESPAQSRSFTFSSLMTKVYLWMTLALAMTSLTALVVANNEEMVYAIATNSVLMWGLLIGEFVLVLVLSAGIFRMPFALAGLGFAAYSILTGVTFSVLFLAYTTESLAATFLVTTGTFGAMSLVGLFIRRDLSAFGRILIMALIGLIIATVVNCFVASTTLAWALNYLGVIIFCGLTAYDTQKMKNLLSDAQGLGIDNAQRIALLCSLTLYLDFVNLFLYLLRFLGRKK